MTQAPALSALTVGSLVAAFYGQGWYRASVQGIGPQEQASIQTIDRSSVNTLIVYSLELYVFKSIVG